MRVNDPLPDPSSPMRYHIGQPPNPDPVERLRGPISPYAHRPAEELEDRIRFDFDRRLTLHRLRDETIGREGVEILRVYAIVFHDDSGHYPEYPDGKDDVQPDCHAIYCGQFLCNTRDGGFTWECVGPSFNGAMSRAKERIGEVVIEGRRWHG